MDPSLWRFSASLWCLLERIRESGGSLWAAVRRLSVAWGHSGGIDVYACRDAFVLFRHTSFDKSVFTNAVVVLGNASFDTSGFMDAVVVF